MRSPGPSPPLNILFVIHTPKDPYTAVYKIYKQLSGYLEKQGHTATILAPEDFPSLSRWHGRWLPLLYPFWVAQWLARQAGQYEIASFHSYAGWVVHLLRRFVPAFRRLRTITSFHGLEPLYYHELKEEMERAGKPLRLRFRLTHGILMPWLIRMSSRRSDRIFCLNLEEATYLEKDNWGHRSRIAVVSHGIPREFFVSREYAEDVLRLLFVGQWLEMKGVRYLVDAFNQIAHDPPKLELWCVGTLVDEESVLATFPPELRSQVVVRPRVGRKELVEVYRNADVFLFPSLYEGFGNVILEALAAGLPIVSTPVGAAVDLLEPGLNALIVPRYDAMALAKSARRLLDDVSLRERLGREARAAAVEYELERVYRKLVSLYEDVLATKLS